MNACSANYHADGKRIENVSADFRVGGFYGTSYVVKISDNILSYRSYRQGTTSEWHKQQLNEKDIKALENKLLKLGVLNWDKQYRNPNVMDGTHWSISYSSKKMKIKSNGSNKYPENYKALIRYISSDLLKGKPFG